MIFQRSLYTHVLPDGTNLHIDAAAIRRLLFDLDWHGQSVPYHNVVVDPANFWTMLEAKQFDPLRCIELAKRSLEAVSEPVIWGLWGSATPGGFGRGTLSGFLMDGHHRYALAVVRGWETIQAWVVPESVWRDFLVDGLPSLTLDELRDLPPTQRSY